MAPNSNPIQVGNKCEEKRGKESDKRQRKAEIGEIKKRRVGEIDRSGRRIERGKEV